MTTGTPWRWPAAARSSTVTDWAAAAPAHIATSAVRGPTAARNWTAESTGTSRTPTARMVWSNTVRDCTGMTTSSRIPSRSGSCTARSGSPPATHAQVAAVSAPAAPLVTSADGTPSNPAIRSPARAMSSSMTTDPSAASAIARRTSGSMGAPPWMDSVAVRSM